MKNKTTILISLITLISYSQNIDFSVPLKTKHFQNKNYVDQIYAKGEGGNIGLIATYSPNKEKSLKNNYTLGVYRNSFGDLTATALYGKNFFINKKTNISANIGIATGYNRLYDSKVHFDKTKKIVSSEYEGNSFIKKNGLTVVYTISIQQVIYKNTYLIASVNHLFTNIGFGYRLNFRKK